MDAYTACHAVFMGKPIVDVHYHCTIVRLGEAGFAGRIAKPMMLATTNGCC